jgi:hypothetical protein
MPATIRRSAACLAVPVLVALLVGGCVGKSGTSTAASQPGTTSTVAPTTTTVPPLTAKELAWLKAIPTVIKKIDKAFQGTGDLTISEDLSIANSLRSCSRELVRGGSPSDRLRPVYALVKKACREYDKGAACFTTAARIGYTYAGSAEDRKQIKAVDCGYAAEAKGAVVLAEAEAKGEEIKTRVG